ncbi:hypothetical protein HNP84_001211 [Thermocatellispora tengchongensis]|uniref:Uncharacterized protein n=1 Tax=Thermocatellispora tengchongensis TaxID=1073253 RepID=A0A840P678_9ACTN|nr:hypothetical protein [Thermocatellispora tengchongensis]MBB5131505.1 hypothetical protein [Thermocatellispora tengchongensis]
MNTILRLFVAPLFAAALAVTALAAPVGAQTATDTAMDTATDTDPQLAAEWQHAWDTHKFYDTTPPAPGSGRSRVQTSISITIDAHPQRVFAVYSNLENHIGRAAFLTRVVTHKDWCEGDTRYINLTAIEEIPYEGQIVVSNTHAQQRIHRDELYYETDTWSLPGVVTHQKIVFTKVKGGTKVTEHLTFDADDSLIDFVVTNGVASHQQTQAALKQAIESGRL